MSGVETARQADEADDTLIRMDACTVVDHLRKGELTPHDLLDALERRVAAVDPKVNALPTLCFERAHAHAERLLALPAACLRACRCRSRI
ncbi:MAG: hypothetical protein J0H17_19720 [Rhizobiales bacterium]|nr:hypothetical protein [Hyphomicrobiales bacterium]